MHVIATAGHVDHGKSTLVRALTGMEPDRWEEERRRGLTIDLGYAWTRLPGGERLAFVDVPGHERFVTNMLAGVGPVPAVMFVVAADEGWMPQSAEHLAAVDALGVRHGLLVVTRADLADPAPARERALKEIRATSLGGDIESVVVSGLTGEGLDDLRAALRRLVARLPEPDLTAPVRLWVDRAFTIKGSGTVVTGTLPAGVVATGDELVLAPTGQVVRVRGLESLKERSSKVHAVARVAVNLRGTGREALARGMALLTPGRWVLTDTLDVRLRGDAAATLPRQLILHVGSAGVAVRVRTFGTAQGTDPEIVRLALSSPLPLHVGDRALLRDPGRRRIVAGVTVLDVRPPALRRRGAAALRLRELRQLTDPADGAAYVRRRGLVRRGDLVAMGVREPAHGQAVTLPGDLLADPTLWRRLRAHLAALVERHAAATPLEPGLPLDAARRALRLPDRRVVEALAAVPGDPALRLSGGRLYLGAGAPDLPARVGAAVERIRADLVDHPFRAPDTARLAEVGLGAREIAAAVRAGALLRIAEGVVLAPDADVTAARILAELPQPFTAAQARVALDTTRRVVIPLLEHLDRRGFTERLDDIHRRCRGRPRR